VTRRQIPTWFAVTVTVGSFVFLAVCAYVSGL
jgi:hypothetical protein